MDTQTADCRVWIGCLAAYNEGTLYGEWVDIPNSVEELKEEISRVLKGSRVPNAEEWAFIDSDIPVFKIGEYESVEQVVAKKLLLDELTTEEIDALEYFDEEFKGDIDDIKEFIDRFRDAYLGCWEWEVDFCEEWYEECGELTNIPQYLRYHINWEGVWRDFTCDGYYSGGSYGNRHIFRSY